MEPTKKDEEPRPGDSPEKVLEWLYGQLETSTDKVIVVQGWCKRCGICVAFCPVKALDRDPEGVPVVDNKKCISCGTCEILCPDFAIVVSSLKK